MAYRYMDRVVSRTSLLKGGCFLGVMDVRGKLVNFDLFIDQDPACSCRALSLNQDCKKDGLYRARGWQLLWVDCTTIGARVALRHHAQKQLKVIEDTLHLWEVYVPTSWTMPQIGYHHIPPVQCYQNAYTAYWRMGTWLRKAIVLDFKNVPCECGGLWAQNLYGGCAYDNLWWEGLSFLQGTPRTR